MNCPLLYRWRFLIKNPRKHDFCVKAMDTGQNLEDKEVLP